IGRAGSPRPACGEREHTRPRDTDYRDDPVTALNQVRAIRYRGERSRTRTRTQLTETTSTTRPQPAPVAPRRPYSFPRHAITVRDDYAWLKDEKWQEVLRDPAVLDPDIRTYLDSENAYTESLLGHTGALQKELVREMRGRVKEDDSSVPSPDG